MTVGAVSGVARPGAVGDPRVRETPAAKANMAGILEWKSSQPM